MGPGFSFMSLQADIAQRLTDVRQRLAGAAVRAGYAVGCAKVTASRLLTLADVRGAVGDLERETADRLRGTVADPRVAVEYSPEHEKAGSIRMYETLPLFSGRSRPMARGPRLPPHCPVARQSTPV